MKLGLLLSFSVNKDTLKTFANNMTTNYTTTS